MDLRTGHPFWMVKNGLLATYPAIAQDETCDVAIVGAGITGALTAEALGRAGLSCVVLDARDAGSGSTVASTALLQYEIDTELHELAKRIGQENAVRAYKLGLEAIDEIERLVEGLPGRCEFERKDSFYFASKPRHAKQIDAEYEIRKANGFDVERWQDSRIAAEFPFTAPCGILSRGDAVVDALQLTHGLLQRALGHGVRIYDRTKMVSFSNVDRAFLLKTDRGPTVQAKRIVFATGYESHEYLKRKRGSLHSTFAAISEPMATLPRWPGHCLLWETARPYFYLRTTADQRILMGGEDTKWASDHRSERRIAGMTDRLVKRFEALMPGHPFEVAYNWAGTFGESDDGLAYIGEPPDQPGLLFAMGFGGNGITFSVLASRILQDLCMGRHNPDAHLYRFDR
jgi:glycine/D-amino acid oxidase-like deaminating enzyme